MRLDVGVPKRPVMELPTPEPMTGAVGEALPNGSTGYGPELGWRELEADLLSLQDDAVQPRHGDPPRVYLTLLCYGGFGTSFLGEQAPARFAAGAPPRPLPRFAPD